LVETSTAAIICDGFPGTPFSGLLPRHFCSESYPSGIDAVTGFDLVAVVVFPLILTSLPCNLTLVFGDSTSARDILGRAVNMRPQKKVQNIASSAQRCSGEDISWLATTHVSDVVGVYLHQHEAIKLSKIEADASQTSKRMIIPWWKKKSDGWGLQVVAQCDIALPL
jgi:phage gp46-like protein